MGWGNNRPVMPAGWDTTRKKVLRSDAKCYLCGQPATEVDHVNPRSRGGGEGDNLRAICARCHRRKSSMEGVNRQRTLRARRKRPVERHPGSTT